MQAVKELERRHAHTRLDKPTFKRVAQHATHALLEHPGHAVSHAVDGALRALDVAL